MRQVDFRADFIQFEVDEDVREQMSRYSRDELYEIIVDFASEIARLKVAAAETAPYDWM